MSDNKIKDEAIRLRSIGKSYSEISLLLDLDIPKSTLSTWMRNIILPVAITTELKNNNLKRLAIARELAHKKNSERRLEYLARIYADNKHLASLIQNANTAKIALAMLFLAEGSKRSGAVIFGNSDPYIIELFLHLLRVCYKLEEDKFRCTVQCRADQDLIQLERFWSDVTNIKPSQFHKAQIDKRSIGKPTKKTDYRGVCRISYYSAHVFNDLSQIPKIFYKGH